MIEKSYADCIELIRKHQYSYPVGVLPIAEELGIRVFKVDAWPDDVSGMIKQDKSSASGYSIYTNEKHSEVRRRFTIAHEISHYLLHKNYIGDGIADDALYRSKLSSKLETEANQMAAEMLMPWHLINKAMADADSSIESLAKKFKVSKSAISIRLGVPY